METTQQQMEYEFESTELNTGRLPHQRASRALRYLGAILLLGSAVAFSLQGWAQWGSVYRHIAFLGFAVALSSLGVLCGVTFREDKGARTFLGVAVAIIPALFAQLGAMSYAFTHAFQNSFPDFLRYAAPGGFTLSTLMLVTTSISSVIAYFGFRVYLGSQARVLTISFIVANLALLIPIRSDIGVAALIATQCIALCAIDIRTIRKAHESKTWEGYAARAIVILPLVVTFFRSALLYSVGSFSYSLLAMAFGVWMLQLALHAPASGNAPLCRVGSLLGFSAAWTFICEGFAQILSVWAYDYSLTSIARVYHSYQLTINLVPIAIICFALSFLFRDKGRGYRSFGSLLAAYAVLGSLFAVGSIVSSLICLFVGGLLLFVSVLLEEKNLLFSGTITFALGIMYQCKQALVLYTISPWFTLAVLGVSVVAGAVYLERRGELLHRRVLAFRERFTTWN